MDAIRRSARRCRWPWAWRVGLTTMAVLPMILEVVRASGTEDEFLSPSGLADLFGIPVSSVYRWNVEGTGPPRCRLGKHVRYRRRDVERWIESRTSGR